MTWRETSLNTAIRRAPSSLTTVSDTTVFTFAGPWPRWLIDHFPYSAQSLYPPGKIYRYLAVLPRAAPDHAARMAHAMSNRLTQIAQLQSQGLPRDPQQQVLRPDAQVPQPCDDVGRRQDQVFE